MAEQEGVLIGVHAIDTSVHPDLHLRHGFVPIPALDIANPADYMLATVDKEEAGDAS